MLSALILNLLILYSIIPAVIPEIVLESSNGLVYVPFSGNPSTTNWSSGTKSGTGRNISSSVKSTLTLNSTSTSNGLSAASKSTHEFSGQSSSALQPTSGFISGAGRNSSSSVKSTLTLNPASTSNGLSAAILSTHEFSGQSSSALERTPGFNSGTGRNNSFSVKSTLAFNSTSTSHGLSAASIGTLKISGQRASASWRTSGFITSNKRVVNSTSTVNNVVRNTATGSSALIRSGPSLTTALSTPFTTGSPRTSTGAWPASITYVSQSSSSTVVGVAFVTTVNGTSIITTTQPQQSLVSPTGSGYSLVAITDGGSTTTLTLATLPSATLPSEPTGIQVVTQSGVPVIYSPVTLSGYSNTEPVEISTSFTETVSGQITVQSGWYVIL